MDSDGNYENYDLSDDDNPDLDGDEFEGDIDENIIISDSSDSDSDPEDSGFSNNENGGSQELTLMDDGPSVLIQPSILDDEADGEDGTYGWVNTQLKLASFQVQISSGKKNQI